ncbi:hypothetical protein AAG570_003053 [Ranatra chinensis]|uniref:Uncharacterized protein n=1 Tax=Ranatra chinensis TaxID=642074 RepID=A0ABD0Y5Q7_9HEMI
MSSVVPIAACIQFRSRIIVTNAEHFVKKKQGPYDIIVKQIAECKERGSDEFKLVGNLIRRHNRTAAIYSGTLVIPREVNNSYKLSPVVAFFGNGGWKSATHGIDVGGVCMLLINFAPSILKTALAPLGVPPPYCPIPPGNYTINNMSLHVDIKMPVVPYTSYRVDFQFFYKDGKKVGCKRIFVQSVPKRGHRG